MINTEEGLLTDLIKMMVEDRLWTSETLGMGPSGLRSRDKTIMVGSPREMRLLRRVKNQAHIIDILREMIST